MQQIFKEMDNLVNEFFKDLDEVIRRWQNGK